MWKPLRVTVPIAGLALASISLAADNAAPDLSVVQAKDRSMSVQTLYEECTGADLPKQMFCVGYISATMDSMTVSGASPEGAKMGICPRVEITAGAAVQVFKNWAQKHPEAWGIYKYLGVAWALQGTWPCK